jgi:hypothetical protein
VLETPGDQRLAHEARLGATPPGQELLDRHGAPHAAVPRAQDAPQTTARDLQTIFVELVGDRG